MGKHDIHNEYGGKAGEIRKESSDFLTKERRYGIHNEYGAKVGEIREHRDYESEIAQKSVQTAGTAVAAVGIGAVILSVLLAWRVPLGVIPLLLLFGASEAQKHVASVNGVEGSWRMFIILCILSIGLAIWGALGLIDALNSPQLHQALFAGMMILPILALLIRFSTSGHPYHGPTMLWFYLIAAVSIFFGAKGLWFSDT